MSEETHTPERLRIDLEGAVQGVGFRPFVYRLASEEGLGGWVVNDPRGVTLEIQGAQEALRRFVRRLRSELPPAAEIDQVESRAVPVEADSGFEIRDSAEKGPSTAQMLPDLATCADCLAELFDPEDRRYRYPFTNCTHCGPRLSIILALPYDRARTTMRDFPMCDACRSEYEDPADRRFHAQPNACADCGPRLELRDAEGRKAATGDEALTRAAGAIASGEIVAVKGLGGFHLMLDARNGEAIRRLRTRKVRREKPLALMARDLEQARDLCRLTDDDERHLLSASSPIVLLPRRDGAPAHEQVAPGSTTLGLMLPYTPLHHLLLRALEGPLVATSGNLSDEPICIDEETATGYLGGIADRFLVHDRPIARQVDDSIVRLFAGGTTMLRRARGYAPRPVTHGRELPAMLAVGAHLKNAVALSVGNRVYVSQHIGDMESPESLQAFERIVDDFLHLYQLEPRLLVHDRHPGYVTTRWALERPPGALQGLPTVAVQHHHAHLASCLADNDETGPALGVIWDGTGYGDDGTVWGGEFLSGDAAGFRRAGHLRPFSLPGGEAAVREPRRVAAALLWEIHGDMALERSDLAPLRSFSDAERNVLAQMLGRGVNAPRATSMGRLFDGVASLLNLRQTLSFEGQAAMALELIADPAERSAYVWSFDAGEDGTIVLDWAPMVEAILEELRGGVPHGRIAARFHNSLVEAILELAHRSGRRKVALSGGCFQNRFLVDRTVERLCAAGFQPLLHRRVPPNDGGIALGQLLVAARALEAGDVPV